MLAPQRKSQGEPVPLHSFMPPGALVVIPGQGEGKIEYSPKGTGYVRISPDQPFETPHSVARELIAAGAIIHRGQALK